MFKLIKIFLATLLYGGACLATDPLSLSVIDLSSVSKESPCLILLSGHLRTAGQEVFQRASANEILFLGEQEYKMSVRRGELPHDSIVFLKELPLDSDFPTVSGVVVEKPLRSRFSHPERQAASLKIPIFVIPDSFNNTRLRSLQGQRRGYQLDSDSIRTQMKILDHTVAIQASTPAKLPVDANRSMEAIVKKGEAGLGSHSLPREIVGDKFTELTYYSETVAGNVPNFSSVTPGYFERFLDTFGVGTTSLREIRRAAIQKLHSFGPTQNTMTNQVLDQLRQQIQESHPLIHFKNENVIETLFSDLVKTYGLGSELSVRSNSDIEITLNTSGLFKSTRLKLMNIKALEDAFKELAAAMYLPVSFQSRQYFGLREETLSMPLLVHPYISGVLAHGVVHISRESGSAAVKPEQIAVSLVVGDNEQATNPSNNAHVYTFTLNPTSMTNLPEPLTRTIKHFFNSYMQQRLSRSISERLYSKGEADMEFVIVPPSHENITTGRRTMMSYPQVVVLQYSVPLPTEVIPKLLSGEVEKDKIDMRVSKLRPQNIAELIRLLDLPSLAAVVKFSAHHQEADQPRFALFEMNNGEGPQFIFWNNGLHHEHMHDAILQHGMKYYAEGILSFRKATLYIDIYRHDDWPESLSVDHFRSLVSHAFKSELGRSSQLVATLKDSPFKIQIHVTSEDSNIHWPQNIELTWAEIMASN